MEGELKCVPCCSHSYEKQDFSSASQRAELSKHKKVPFCKSTWKSRWNEKELNVVGHCYPQAGWNFLE